MGEQFYNLCIYCYVEPTLKALLNELHPVRGSWYNIGLQLDVPRTTLDCFKLNHSDPSDLMREVLSSWLDTAVDPRPTWKAVITALRSPIVGKMSVAEQLESKYCAPVRQESNSHGNVEQRKGMDGIMQLVRLVFIHSRHGTEGASVVLYSASKRLATCSGGEVSITNEFLNYIIYTIIYTFLQNFMFRVVLLAPSQRVERKQKKIMHQPQKPLPPVQTHTAAVALPLRVRNLKSHLLGVGVESAHSIVS